MDTRAKYLASVISWVDAYLTGTSAPFIDRGCECGDERTEQDDAEYILTLRAEMIREGLTVCHPRKSARENREGVRAVIRAIARRAAERYITEVVEEREHWHLMPTPGLIPWMMRLVCQPSARGSRAFAEYAVADGYRGEDAERVIEDVVRLTEGRDWVSWPESARVVIAAANRKAGAR